MDGQNLLTTQYARYLSFWRLGFCDLVHGPQLLVREDLDRGLVMLEPCEKLVPLEHPGGLGGSTKELMAAADI